MKLYCRPVGAIGTNCYIVAADNGECAVVDPGAQADRLISFLDRHALTPKYILLTHGHYDHIGGVKAIAKKFGAKIVIGREDAEQLYDIHKSLALARSMSEEIYVMQPDILVKEGDQLEVGELLFLVYDTPGHTKGDVTYQCGNLLFTGDTMFAGDVGRCDLYGGDYRAILRSVKKLAALPGDYRVLPGHGPESTLEQERRYNQYVRMNPDDPVY